MMSEQNNIAKAVAELKKNTFTDEFFDKSHKSSIKRREEYDKEQQKLIPIQQQLTRKYYIDE